MKNTSTIEDMENALIELGLDVIHADRQCIRFWLNGNEITYWVKKQWATGRGIEDGRGWKNLYNQLKELSEL